MFVLFELWVPATASRSPAASSQPASQAGHAVGTCPRTAVQMAEQLVVPDYAALEAPSACATSCGFSSARSVISTFAAMAGAVTVHIAVMIPLLLLHPSLRHNNIDQRAANWTTCRPHEEEFSGRDSQGLQPQKQDGPHESEAELIAKVRMSHR